MKTSRKKIPVGILYSITGPYGEINQSMVNAAIMGLEDANREIGEEFQVIPIFMDCGGKLSSYGANCDNLINTHDCHHIIGCYTSAARKHILPLLERTNTLLWHTARYEGFEASENVIYVGAAPNQHLLPLVRYLLAEMTPEVYCVGSNYIWTWESNRVLRDLVIAGGGHILAQRTITMGDTEIDHIVHEIIALRPPVVFNTLVGEASYRFHRALWRAISLHPDLQPGDITILSCSLGEGELPLIGEPASIGHITSATYFQSIDSPENRRFLDRYRDRFGTGASPSVDAEAAYICARMLGRSVAACGTDSVDMVRAAAYEQSFDAPQGAVRIDPATNHCHLTPRLAISTRGFAFDLFWEADSPVRPDPYLAWQDDPAAQSAPSLIAHRHGGAVRIPGHGGAVRIPGKGR